MRRPNVARSPADTMNEREVADYLIANPDFFAEHAELLGRSGCPIRTANPRCRCKSARCKCCATRTSRSSGDWLSCCGTDTRTTALPRSFIDGQFGSCPSAIRMRCRKPFPLACVKSSRCRKPRCACGMSRSRMRKPNSRGHERGSPLLHERPDHAVLRAEHRLRGGPMADIGEFGLGGIGYNGWRRRYRQHH